MKKINIKLDVLREILKTNMQKHKEDYEKALLAWKQEMVDKFKQSLLQFEKDEYPDRPSDLIRDLDRPVSYEEDYQEALDMLSYETSDTVELDTQSFRKYIKDEWDWKELWSMSNTKYLSK